MNGRIREQHKRGLCSRDSEMKEGLLNHLPRRCCTTAPSSAFSSPLSRLDGCTSSTEAARIPPRTISMG